MANVQKRLKNFLINYFALPSDVILELPKITVIGQIHVYIENHKGLVTYSDTELKLKANKGYIQIKGDSFVLKMMLPEEILLEGTVTEVKFLPS